MSQKISKAVIARLPKYYRYLNKMKEQGIERVSSEELSHLLNSTASQVRQDFNNFGGFGQQGYGYNVKELFSQIERILGLGSSYNTIIVGSGNIGQALANYKNFENYGFKLIAMFDLNPKLVGLNVNGVEILDVEKLQEFLSKNSVDIAYICTGEHSAQKTAEILEKGGVKGIWNFAPVDLELGENIIVENVHLIEGLITMSYYLNGEAR